MDILCIIQARSGSTRLPNKVLLSLEGKTVLEHVIERVSHSKLIDEVVVATTFNKEDIKIVNIVSGLGYRVFAGSEDDVLDRYYQCARLIKPKNIVRITSDCPLIDPDIIDYAIDNHIKSGADYTSNTLKETYPDGLDVEVFTYEALFEAWKNAKLTSEREHVTPYIRKNDKFKKYSVENDIDLSYLRWTLDREQDYKFIKEVYKHLYKQNNLFKTKEVLELLEKYTHLIEINKDITRNEGYQVSLKNDKILSSDYLNEIIGD